MDQPVPGEARLTLAAPVHGVTVSAVVTEALVDTARPEPSLGTRLGAVRACPASTTPAGAGHVVTLRRLQY